MFAIGLSVFEHSLVSLAAFAHNSKERRLFSGIVRDNAVYVTVLRMLTEMMMTMHPHNFPPRPFRCDAFKKPYADLPLAVQVIVLHTIDNPHSAVKHMQNELKNAALDVVNDIVDLSARQASALTSLRQEFVLIRRFAQCLVVVQDNLTRPDLTGTMAHLQNVQVCRRCCRGAAVGETLLSGCPCNRVFYHGKGASSTEIHPGRVPSYHSVSLCSHPPNAVLGP